MPKSKFSAHDSRPQAVNILLISDETIEVEGEKAMTTEEIKKRFTETIQDRYGLDERDALQAISGSDVVPFVPVREEKIGDAWVAATVKNNHDTMANVFSENHSGLFLVRLSEEFKASHRSSQVHQTNTLRDKAHGEDASQKVPQLIDRIEKMEAALTEELERSKEAEERLEEALRAEAQRSKEAEEQLRADLDRERRRAQLAEENLEEVNNFIATGSREDTTAFFSIKIRYLVSVVQGQLAYAAGWSRTADDRSGSRLWRQKLAKLDSKDKKIAKAEGDLMSCSAGKDQEHLQETIIATNALEILVDDSALRSARDAAAHPGPLTKDNAEAYRIAVQAIGKNERALEGCITYLLEK